ncbi:MAG: ATP-dependent zinc metalloprotease FtsH [Intestinimonas sp.]|jgi:cell division protease FtsH|nr:ATP-dependent zinc metalloprotease FtsH [Intestinimonas sp.]
MMGIISIILWALIITLAVNYFTSSLSNSHTTEIKYSDLIQMVKDDKVKEVVFESGNNKITITPKEDASADDDQQDTTVVPGLESLGDLSDGAAATYYCAPINEDRERLISLLDEHDVTYSAPYVEELSPIISFLVSWVLPMAVMMVLMSLLFRGMSTRMGGGLGGVGKANAKVYVEKKTGVTFRDVAGQDEAKESLEEIIDFLHNPQKYTEIGAKLPKGALLVGSPGTGKTLLAKAVAGEANVPFFSISGSDFVEMFVGVGASRVRDLFKEAAKMAPCIIFIDEIDTIGKSRDNRMGGNDEREQTLNQLLAELDGFDPTKGVIVLAATNRPEVLDKALLRPGRFDRRIIVDRPNLAGRLATLQVHTRNIRLAEDVDLNKIAQATAGCVGADLANLVNEAALRAVRLGRRAVNQRDLLASFELVIAGSEKKGTVITEKEKKLIAYHEVGHALVAARQKNAQPVSKITIVPHTQGALGYTMQLPEEEKFLMTKDDLLTEIRTLLAGRSAEEVVFGTMTSGASNDIERATDLARKMVTMYGMSDKFGMMGLATVKSQYLEGNYGLNCAQETAAVIDREVQDLLQKCHADSVKLLEENRDMLNAIALYLLKKETITGAEMMAILAGKDPEQAEDQFGAGPASEPPAAPKIEDPSAPIPLSGGDAPAPETSKSGEETSSGEEPSSES